VGDDGRDAAVFLGWARGSTLGTCFSNATLLQLFDWLVVGQVVATNPAHSVRGRSETPMFFSSYMKVPGIFCAAVGMFLMKPNRLMIYAILELIFALLSIAVAANFYFVTHGSLLADLGPKPNPFLAGSSTIAWFQIGAGVYLAVRGLDNLEKSIWGSPAGN
jgi:hypothetical protein